MGTSFFMGARGRPGNSTNRCAIELADADSDAERGHQFARLRAQVMEPRVAIVFHLSNHYALVYGYVPFFKNALTIHHSQACVVLIGLLLSQDTRVADL